MRRLDFPAGAGTILRRDLVVTNLAMSDDTRPAPHPDTRSVDPAADPGDDPWAAFEPLYSEHQDHLYRIAVLLCSGRIADAEDAVAETFVKVHRAWADGRVEEFFPYLRRSLVNHVMGRYRREQTATRYLRVTSIDQAAGRPIDQHVVDSAVVTGALDHLTSRQRTAVVLRYFEDLPYHAIAEEMGVAVGTAKAQVSVGLSNMRRLLTESGDDE
jgi:RNA polymerase sigma factor (sigma-70 family)